MIFNINSTRGQTRFLTCVARVTCLVRNKKKYETRCSVLLKPAHNSAQLRCLENGNDDFGVEAFWIGDAARVGYFVPLNGPLNGHPPSNILCIKVQCPFVCTPTPFRHDRRTATKIGTHIRIDTGLALT